jgi:hypothetical protein
MSVQTLFDYRRNGPPVIQKSLLPRYWWPKSFADELATANVNVREINGKIYKTKASIVTGAATFPGGGAPLTVTLADGFTFNNSDWSVGIMPAMQMTSDGPWAKVTGPNTFQCGSGAASSDLPSYLFSYTATGIVTDPVAAKQTLDYGPVTKKGPLWYQ